MFFIIFKIDKNQYFVTFYSIISFFLFCFYLPYAKGINFYIKQLLWKKNRSEKK